MTITLLGICHNDWFGSERLRRALETEQPDILTLETSPEYLAYYTSGRMVRDALRNMNRWRIPPDTDVREFITNIYCYEWREPLAYASRKNIPCHPIDDPIEAHKVMEAQRNMKQPKFPAELPGYDRDKDLRDAQAGYAILEKLFHHTGEGILISEQELTDSLRRYFTNNRDETPAHHLWQLQADNPNKKIVHVGGGYHCLDDVLRHTLYAKIKGPNTIRTSLSTY